MVVGPEFGPIAGDVRRAVERRPRARAALGAALVVGFPLAIAVVYAASRSLKASAARARFGQESTAVDIISQPDFFTFFVAACAGAAGMLSLSTAKSGALIGVLISVTTIPAAADVGVAAAYRDWSTSTASIAQLGINLGSIIVAGTAVLYPAAPLHAPRAPRRRQGPGPHRRAQRRPDLDLGPHLLDHGVRELGRRGLAAEVERLAPPAVVSSVPS